MLRFAFAILMAALTPQPIGPYALLTSPGAVTVYWTPSATLVKYGAMNRMNSAVASDGENRARLAPLAASQVYHYEIPGVGQGSFVTPPPAAPIGMSRYSFAVLGSNSGDSPAYREVAGAIASANPSFVVHAGNIVADPAQWTSFFNVSREYLRNTVFFPALGAVDSPEWHRYFDRQRAYYSFDWSSSHWVVMSAAVLSAAEADSPDSASYWKSELDWLERDLTAHANAAYLFVVIHRLPADGRVAPILEKSKVSAVFSASEENFQRRVSNGIMYIGAGTSDGYVLARAQGATVAAEARAGSGRVIDRFEIPARLP